VTVRTSPDCAVDVRLRRHDVTSPLYVEVDEIYNLASGFAHPPCTTRRRGARSKSLVRDKTGNVASGAGEKLVDANNIATAFQQALAQM
jgi:hypothetical protein